MAFPADGVAFPADGIATPDRIPTACYRGRFAPSPTGPLHLGSLTSALACYLDARASQGIWLVRMEDVDGLRCRPVYADAILHCLEAHGLYWDHQVVFQHQRSEAYRDAIDTLRRRGDIYYCPCTRKALRQSGGKHPASCYETRTPPREPAAVRFHVPDMAGQLFDQIQGHWSYRLRAGIDDFAVQRRDGFFAYQLACICDDASQQITHVVRGADQLALTPAQRLLQIALGYPIPHYGHIPVVTDKNGIKLSKQSLAPALDPDTPIHNLRQALRCMNQEVPDATEADRAEEVIHWAITHWIPARMPQQMATIGI